MKTLRFEAESDWQWCSICTSTLLPQALNSIPKAQPLLHDYLTKQGIDGHPMGTHALRLFNGRDNVESRPQNPGFFMHSLNSGKRCCSNDRHLAGMCRLLADLATADPVHCHPLLALSSSSSN